MALNVDLQNNFSFMSGCQIFDKRVLFSERQVKVCALDTFSMADADGAQAFLPAPNRIGSPATIAPSILSRRISQSI
jgi:hypothetical protein